MDLKDVWEVHKRFIVTTGSGALVFAIFASTITGMERSAEAMARTNANQQSELLRSIDALKKSESAEKGKKKSLEETAAPAILKALTWTVDKDYVLGAGEKNPAVIYADLASKATLEVTRVANNLGIKIQRNQATQKADLGLDESPNLEGPRASEALARIDLARRVMLALLEARVSRVAQVRPGEASYQALEGGGGFLRRIPVTIVFEGGTQELAKVLATFEAEGAFLELGSLRTARIKDSRPEEGRLEVDLELGALTVEKEAPAGTATDKPGNDPGKPPVIRRRRDR